MLNMNFRANIKAALKKDRMMDNIVGAAIAPITYVVIPSLFGASNWTGLLLGSALTWGAGAMFGNVALQAAGFVLPTIHLTYSYLHKPIESFIDKPLWNFLDANGEPALKDYYLNQPYAGQYSLRGLGNVPMMTTTQDGQQVFAYPAADLPSGVNDYVDPNLEDDFENEEAFM